MDQEILDALVRIEKLCNILIELGGLLVGWHLFALVFGWIKGIVKW